MMRSFLRGVGWQYSRTDICLLRGRYHFLGVGVMMSSLCRQRIETRIDEGVTGTVRGGECPIVWAAGDFGLS